MKKRTFIGLIILGMISTVLAVLGPLHEIWHVIASMYYGYLPQMHWGWTELASQNHTLPVCFAGLFGEILTLVTLFIIAFRKGYYKTAIYLFGYMLPLGMVAILSGQGHFMLDIEAALEIASPNTVQFIYNIWKIYFFILLTLPIGIIISKNRLFFTNNAKISSNIPKNSKKILTIT